MILLKLNGVYHTGGKILFETNKSINWYEITSLLPPEVPHGSNIEITISFDDTEFLSGKNGIVWATYDSRQAEIIQSSLLAQHISSEVRRIDFMEDIMFVIKITNEIDVNGAIEFIWKSKNGLRLKPDWRYSAGETNKSFEQWLSGN